MTATGIPGQYLLIRRLLSRSDQYTFYLCWAPPDRPATMTYFITIAGRRWPVEETLCATRRLVVSPPQVGETRREVSGSDGLPGAERLRGQEHARKPATRSRCMEWCAEGTRVIRRKLDCLKPNLQEMQLPIRRKDT
jgi:hypothetical protein